MASSRDTAFDRFRIFAGLGKRPLALPCLDADLPLTEFERSLLDFVLDLDLKQPLAGGVIVMSCGLVGQLEGSLPHPISKLGNFGRHTCEGGGVALDAGAQVTPKPPQRIPDGVG